MSQFITSQNLGVLFDWDGVVIDSHDQHEQSWQQLFEEEGHAMPEDFFKKTFGMRNQQIIPTYFHWIDPANENEIARLALRKEELYRAAVIKNGLDPLPGVVALLDDLASHGVPCSIGSSTPRANLDFALPLLGLEGRFSALTTAEDVTRGKPAPDVFLKAAEKIGRDPRNCVVLEDAHVGIAAGLAAGCRVLAVATTHPAASLADAHAVVESLDGIGVQFLLALFDSPARQE